MTLPWQEVVEQARRDLANLAALLATQSEQLWLSADFGRRADEFGDRLDKAFARIVPVRLNRDREEPPISPADDFSTGSAPDEWSPTTLATAEIEDWEYVAPLRVRPAGRWAQLVELFTTLIGCEHPASDYLRSVRLTRRTVSRTVPDRRVPGEGPQQVTVSIQVHKCTPPACEPPRRARRDESWFAAASLWWDRVAYAWAMLGGSNVPDADYEHRLELAPEEQRCEVTLPAIALDDVSLVERKYWNWRRRIERDVRDLTDFILKWDAAVGEQGRRTDELTLRQVALARQVTNLPRTDEIAGQIADHRATMKQTLEQFEQECREIDSIMQQFASLQERARTIRPEMFR